MTLQDLIKNNYTVLNGRIEEVFLNATEDALILSLFIKGDGWTCRYADYNVAGENIEGGWLLIDLLNTIGVEDFLDIKGNYVRVAVKTLEEPVEYIGNIIEDKWFNYNNYEKVDLTAGPDIQFEPVEEKEDSDIHLEEVADDPSDEDEE